MKDTIRVGDFVRCRSKYHRDQLGLPPAPGLVIGIKRSNFKVLFGEEKLCWLPGETLARIAGDAGDSTFAGRLAYMIRRVRAHECELFHTGDACRLSLQIDRIDVETIDDLRGFLGEKLVALEVVPEGMAFMVVEISFRT